MRLRCELERASGDFSCVFECDHESQLYKRLNEDDREKKREKFVILIDFEGNQGGNLCAMMDERVEINYRGILFGIVLIGV